MGAKRRLRCLAALGALELAELLVRCAEIAGLRLVRLAQRLAPAEYARALELAEDAELAAELAEIRSAGGW